MVIVNMSRNTPTLKQLDKFWASDINKVSIQDVFRNYVVSISEEFKCDFFSSSKVVDGELVVAIKNQSTTIDN